MSDSTKEQILQAAKVLFANKGFYGASLSNIANELGISKQGLLHHFGSKEKLYGCVLENIATAISAGVTQIEQEYDNAWQQLEQVLQLLEKQMIQDRPAAQLLMRELLDNPQRAYTAVNWYLTSLLEGLVRIVDKGQASGEFRELSSIAFVYNLVGALHYFLISLPTLKQILNASDYKVLLKNQFYELKELARYRLLILRVRDGDE